MNLEQISYVVENRLKYEALHKRAASLKGGETLASSIKEIIDFSSMVLLVEDEPVLQVVNRHREGMFMLPASESSDRSAVWKYSKKKKVWVGRTINGTIDMGMFKTFLGHFMKEEEAIDACINWVRFGTPPKKRQFYSKGKMKDL